MALGYNRKYNSLRGIPVDSGELTPSAPPRGTVAAYGDKNLPVVVETIPKTGAGLPGGGNAEQYIVDMSMCIWTLRVFANGSTINDGDSMSHIVSAATASYSGNAQVGDLTNANTARTGLTFVALDDEHQPIVKEVLDGSSVTSTNSGDADVIMGI